MQSDEITFGRFRLDLRRRELSRDGARSKSSCTMMWSATIRGA
jgi:hypothetical protein